jgi:hypothetical protein
MCLLGQLRRPHASWVWQGASESAWGPARGLPAQRQGCSTGEGSEKPYTGAAPGPEEDLKPLLEQLKTEGVFVRELDTRGLAFHSPVLQPHLPELRTGARARLIWLLVR